MNRTAVLLSQRTQRLLHPVLERGIGRQRGDGGTGRLAAFPGAVAEGLQCGQDLGLTTTVGGGRRARRIDFAAMDFLMGSDRRVSRSLRMRELLLLIARVAVFLVVPLLLAKPFVSCDATGPTVARGPQGAVLVIESLHRQ